MRNKLIIASANSIIMQHKAHMDAHKAKCKAYKIAGMDRPKFDPMVVPKIERKEDKKDNGFLYGVIGFLFGASL